MQTLPIIGRPVVVAGFDREECRGEAVAVGIGRIGFGGYHFVFCELNRCVESDGFSPLKKCFLYSI